MTVMNAPTDPAPVESRRVRPMVWIGVVLGILWIGGLGSLVALIVGFYVRDDAANERERRWANVSLYIGVVGAVLLLLGLMFAILTLFFLGAPAPENLRDGVPAPATVP